MKNHWDDETEALITEYNTDTPNREEIAIRLQKQNPMLLKYLLTTLDSCIGNHQVYLVTFKNKISALCNSRLARSSRPCVMES